MVILKLLTPLAVCMSLATAAPTNSMNGTLSLPQTYGIVLYRNYDPLDIIGPLEVLMHIGKMHKTDIALISSSLDPVSSRPEMPAMNPLNSSVYMSILPTHTFSTAPDLDVLIVAGGPGWRNPAHNSTADFVRQTAKKVRHVLTICTGSALAARAGILDGRTATTNKFTWETNVAAGPNTTWVTSARWVEDDGDKSKGEVPIWSSSGVASGVDLMLRWVEYTYGGKNASAVERIMEWERVNQDQDKWARE